MQCELSPFQFMFFNLLFIGSQCFSFVFIKRQAMITSVLIMKTVVVVTAVSSGEYLSRFGRS